MRYIYRRQTGRHQSICESWRVIGLTRSIAMPKLPLVSNSLIFLQPPTLSQTLIRPSTDVAARYCPSAERAMAQISPALLPSDPRRAQLRACLEVWEGDIRTYNISLLHPLTFLRAPELDISRKACTSKVMTIFGCCQMVYPKLVRCVQGLCKREVRLTCRIDLDIRRTRSRDDLVRGHSKRENVGDVS